MIKAVIFDLDGTLIQTEILKAQSYAKAATELCNGSLSESEVIGAFKQVVGRSRKEVAQYLLEHFNLENEAQKFMTQYGVETPWQAYVQVRLEIYQSMLNDPDLLRKYRCPYNMALLRRSCQNHYCTGLATMSHCEQARRVLKILEINDKFDFIATRDDVEYSKPNPEIYHLVASQLNVKPESCLVIEDSVTGVMAAIAANMHCIAVTTEFTKTAIHESGILDQQWIVDDPKNLLIIAKKKYRNR